jgi:hypothetical protein
MRELLEERRPVYESLAWLTVATDDREPPEIAELIAEAVAGSIAADVGEGAGSGDGWAAATVTEAGGTGGGPGGTGGGPGPEASQ